MSTKHTLRINRIALAASICLLLFALFYFPESVLSTDLYREEMDTLTDLALAKLRLTTLLNLIDYAQGFSALFFRIFLLFSLGVTILLALNIRVIRKLEHQLTAVEK